MSNAHATAAAVSALDDRPRPLLVLSPTRPVAGGSSKCRNRDPVEESWDRQPPSPPPALSFTSSRPPRTIKYFTLARLNLCHQPCRIFPFARGSVEAGASFTGACTASSCERMRWQRLSHAQCRQTMPFVAAARLLLHLMLMISSLTLFTKNLHQTPLNPKLRTLSRCTEHHHPSLPPFHPPNRRLALKFHSNPP